jgi:hypothetical protein
MNVVSLKTSLFVIYYGKASIAVALSNTPSRVLVKKFPPTTGGIVSRPLMDENRIDCRLGFRISTGKSKS